MNSDFERAIDYHERTKHHYGRFARGPGRLDWATQPDPFRRYRGAPEIALERPADEEPPSYARAFVPGATDPRPLDRSSVSRLFILILKRLSSLTETSRYWEPCWTTRNGQIRFYPFSRIDWTRLNQPWTG